MDLFDLDFEEHPRLQDIVHHYFYERFKGYRYRCHKKYQDLIKERKDPLQHLPNQYIKSADWEWMCINCFGNEEWQNINSSSDSNTSGGYFEFFKKTHWSDSRGWTTERAKEDYDQIIKIRDARLSELSEGSELDSDVEEEIYSQVLSSARYEKYGFKRGIDMEYQLKEQRELIQNLLQRLNVPSNHPGPTLPSNEDPPPPPAPAAVC
ncbi:hypothetical protein TIFTF001_042472 [Ficus carica]|uniref:Uncharacterized protein n=1 Tax=Ficus carica TaxID=3494 RepID=A0AA88D0B4_FICCA|nr:hypothetical protein TIFTF001_042472 [Ficus carica]